MHKALETSATVDDAGILHSDEPLPDLSALKPSTRVRIIILLPEPEEPTDISGDSSGDSLTEPLTEAAWLRAASHNPAFDFLTDPAEDLYSLTDGKPFIDHAS